VVFAFEGFEAGNQTDCTRSWRLRRRSKCQRGHGIAANVGAGLRRAHQARRRLAHGARGSTAAATDPLIADYDGRRRSLSGYLGQAQVFVAILASPGVPSWRCPILSRR